MTKTRFEIYKKISFIVFYIMLLLLFLRADFLKFETSYAKISISTVKNTVLLFIILYLPTAFISLKESMKKSKIVSFLLLSSYLLIILSIIFSPYGDFSKDYKQIMVITVYFLFFFIMKNGLVKDWKIIKKILICSFFIVAVTNIVFHVFHGMDKIIESYPFWPGKNMFAVFLMLGLFVIMDEMFSATNKKERNILLPLLILGIVSLLFAYSRAALLSFVIGLIAFLFMRRGKRKASIIILFFLLLSANFVPGIKNRIKEGVMRKDYNTKERIAIWKGTMKMIQDRPLLGVGASHFSEVFFNNYSDFKFERKKEKEKEYHSHNLLLQFFSESGVPVGIMLLIAYFLIIIGSLKKQINEKTQDYGLICALFAYSIYSIFDSTYNGRFTDASMFHVNLIVLVFLARLLYLNEKKIDGENKK